MVLFEQPLVNEEKYRTYNVKVSDGGKEDWSHRMPWRLPGKASVRGSGCGVAGGSPVLIPNGGMAPKKFPMGMDGLDLPAMTATEWELGSVVEMAWAITANHGGGYSWRLCKKSAAINEECFQKNSLRFHGNSSWIQYSDSIPNRFGTGYLTLPRVELPRVDVPSDLVHPKGSHWARNPIPSCFYCDQATCGSGLPNLTEPVTDPTAGQGQFGGDAWWREEKCAQQCSGFNLMQCPPGMTQFQEPLPGLSGYLGAIMVNFKDPVSAYGLEGFSFNIVDKLEIPSDLEAGDYLLSWRWDCEQSPQIWQNCADVRLVAPREVHI